MDLVSIIMNCHNGERYLEESLKSIICQTYKNWELIFFDNCSKDKSKKIVEKFNDKRIKYYKSEKFVDLYEARNLAIEKSNGKYIGFLDTDDLWTCDKIEKQISFLKKNSQYKIVYSNYFIKDEKNKNSFIKYNSLLPSGLITQKLLDSYCIGILTVFLEKDFFKNYFFRNSLNIIGDFDFFINLSQKFEIGSIQEPLATYRIHKNNFSSRKIDLYKKELQLWIKNNEKNLLSQNLNLRNQKILLFKLKIKNFLINYIKF